MMAHVMINRYPAARMKGDSQAVRKGLLGMGVVMCLLGTLAVLLPVAAGIAVELVLGVMLLVAGVVGMLQAVAGEGRRWSALAIGLIAALAGLFLLVQPVGGTVVLATVLAVYFLLDGIFGIATALYARHTAAAGMVGLGAALSLLLGIVMLVVLPEAAPWILGLVLGIHLLADGIFSLVMSNRLKRSAAASA